MAMIAFRTDDELKQQLEAIAENKGINLSALIKLYLTRAVKEDLQEATFEGTTVAEELKEAEKEAQATLPPIRGGKVYNTAEELLASLQNDNESEEGPQINPKRPSRRPWGEGRDGMSSSE